MKNRVKVKVRKVKMKKGTTRAFVRPDTGSSLLRRMEEPEEEPESAPKPPSVPPPSTSRPSTSPSVTSLSSTTGLKERAPEEVAREEIFSRISTSSISLKPSTANRRSFSNTRVGSHTTTKDSSPSNRKNEEDNVSGKISLAYSMVSVDSVDSVDTVNSVRINETKAESILQTSGKTNGDSATESQLSRKDSKRDLPPVPPREREPPPVPSMESLISRRASSSRNEIYSKLRTNGGEASSIGGSRSQQLSTTTTTTAIATTTTTTNGVKPGENGKLGQEKSAYERFATGGSEKKKPEIKAKPKLPKVIPVVKKVSTEVMKPKGTVGFCRLPKQLHRRAVRRGFHFTLMVVGESGLGKSTLVNSMFLTDIYSSKLGSVPKPEQTLEVDSHSIMLEEGGVKLALTVLDTPGFGDRLDNSTCWYPISCYVEEQFDKFLEAETRVNRKALLDTRVHACLYFIAPNGHKLKELDVEFMKRLCNKVNIIPVIAKSDCLTKDELLEFKKRITSQLQEHDISTYKFSTELENSTDKWMCDLAPFAVVGSNSIIQDASGNKVRGRSYPWGSVSIEDKQHCDFLALRTLLLSHHMQDLIETTSLEHYENYRSNKLREVQQKFKNGSEPPNKNPLAALEDERNEHDQKVLQMTLDMESVFRRKVEEKEEKMVRTSKEEEEKLELSKKELDEVKEALERKRAELEEEKKTWESENNTSLAGILLAGSTDSLGSRKKKHSMTVNPFKFGRT